MIYVVDCEEDQEGSDGLHLRAPTLEGQIEQYDGKSWSVVGLIRRRCDGALEQALFDNYSSRRTHCRTIFKRTAAERAIDTLSTIQS